MEAESKALAAALFVTKDDKRDHWTAAGQQLLAAIILYVYVSPEIPKNKKDLPTVRRLLLGEVKPTLDAMLEIDDADGLLRDLAISFIETPAKEFGSIVSTAQRQTEILDNPAIIACLSASGHGEEVDFAQWHRGTMTVYLCLSAPKFPVFNRWLRLVLTSALDEMTDSLDPPQLPVCFMLDELATLGHVAPIENAVGLAAGYGVQCSSCFRTWRKCAISTKAAGRPSSAMRACALCSISMITTRQNTGRISSAGGSSKRAASNRTFTA